jgi:hypothetical protein
MTSPSAREAHVSGAEHDLGPAVLRLEAWLRAFGEGSQDHYDLWAHPLGQRAKAFYYRSRWAGAAAVAPLVLLDSLVPSARRFFRHPTRFPIADAHFAMGYAALHQATGLSEHYDAARHFLEVLLTTRCPGYAHYAWGYPFDWITNGGTVKAATPLITTVPYVYEAFLAIHEIDGDPRWRDVARSAAAHAAEDYRDLVLRPGVHVTSYVPANRLHPEGHRHIVNASAYRAFLLLDAARRFDEPGWATTARANLAFVLEAQAPDGSWLYATDGSDPFIDHFHTCFVLKNLAKIERLTGSAACRSALERGVGFYRTHLFDREGRPKPFAREQRPTLYRRVLYDYAEAINLCLLLRDRFPELEPVRQAILRDLFARWQRPEGGFRTFELLLGWNATPYHRWGHSQLFRALCLCYRDETLARREEPVSAAAGLGS